MEDILVLPEGLKMALNYGLDSVRFIQPVKVDSRVRLRVELADATEKSPGNGCSRSPPPWKSKARKNRPILPSHSRCASSDSGQPASPSRVNRSHRRGASIKSTAKPVGAATKGPHRP